MQILISSNMPERSCSEIIFLNCFVPFGGFLIILLHGIFKPFVTLYKIFRNALSAKTTPASHARKVKLVQDQVLDWIRNGKKTKLCTGRRPWHSLNWRTPLYKRTMTGICMDGLDGLVDLDTANQTVTVESLMSMGKLSALLVPMGWTLPIIPEMKSLTIGGLINGAGVQSSSHKYGELQHICISFEIMLANGEIVNCSTDENSDLFHAIPMSYGTLGFLTAATLKIIPVKKYMRLEYIPAHSLDEIVSTMESRVMSDAGNDYVEGILYGLDKGVIIVGNMVSEPEAGKINRMGRWYKPWYYKHVESFLRKQPGGPSSFVEYVPPRDYFHRYETSYFWIMEILCPIIKNPIFRFLFGWILPPNILLLKHFTPQFIKSKFDNHIILQDYAVHVKDLKESLILADREVRVYPTWLCGVKIPNCPGVHDLPGKTNSMFVGMGLYGIASSKNYEMERSMKTLEGYCLKNDGYIATYADMFLTKEQFLEMFNYSLYYKMRDKLDCADAFPEAYDKLNRTVRR